SDFIRQNSSYANYSENMPWTVISTEEEFIKERIENIGTPLKQWDISINYGVKTGLNEAFIISKEQRDLLISQDPKSSELISPLLRGRNIKKYGYKTDKEFLICTFPSKKYDIDDYRAVKEWLINGDWVLKKTKKNPPTPLGSGRLRLEQLGKELVFEGVRFKTRKKASNKWFEIQDSINYSDDFSKQKIMYPNMTKYLPFYLDSKGFYTNDKGFIITGNNLFYLVAFLNSSLFKYAFINSFPDLQGGTRELRKTFLELIPVKKITKNRNKLYKTLINNVQYLKENGQDTKDQEKSIDLLIYEDYGISESEQKMIGASKDFNNI
ncbi:TaqI-like C-terminal specificity domain-containing protein, partial [Enterococcus hulanensis]|uniref:TaqI-like C-terminal specificity domain-containing protein n=1 Tax=Enterococcus hulanensis TaxID=2559929 RepID=UPI002891FE10